MESREMKIVVISLLLFAHIFFVSLYHAAAVNDRKLHIAMILWRGETEAETGFKDGLKERGYAVVYSSFDSQQDLKELGRTLHVISPEIEKYDYIYTFGTTVSRRVKLVINNRIPQIFNAVTDPVGAGIVGNSTSPGEMISGASDAIPLSLQIKGMRDVMDIDRLGFFFNPREKNSMLIRGELYQHALKNKFEIIDFRSPPAGKLLEENLQRVVDEPSLVDAVFFPSDSFLASRAEYIGRKLREGRIASFGSLEEYIENGLLMGFVVDYYSLGKAAATIVDLHQAGHDFRNIPIVLPSDYHHFINIRTKELLDFPLSEELLEDAIIYN